MFSTAKIIDCSRSTRINNILLESFNNLFITHFRQYLKMISSAIKKQYEIYLKIAIVGKCSWQ